MKPHRDKHAQSLSGGDASVSVRRTCSSSETGSNESRCERGRGNMKVKESREGHPFRSQVRRTEVHAVESFPSSVITWAWCSSSTFEVLDLRGGSFELATRALLAGWSDAS